MLLQDSQKQIEAMARRVMRRITHWGITGYELEDVVSELTVAWCIARESYDPQKGASFRTYLHGGMLLHINRVLEREGKHINREAQSEGKALRQISLDADYEEETPLHELVADEAAGPHEIAEHASHGRLLDRKLKPQTRTFVRLLENPNEDLVEMLAASQERAAFARQRGIGAVAPKQVTTAMVFDYMGCSRDERSKINRELSSFISKINQK